MQKSKKFIALCKKYGVNPDVVPEVMDFEAACKITGDDPTQLPIVEHVAARHQKRLLSDYKLSIIAEALKDNKKVDYTTNQFKYNSVFRVKATKKNPSGVGLSYGDYDYWRASSGVGVRLCFPNRDTESFFGQHFLGLHTDHQLYT
jgi:hypothetical protein